VTRDVSEQGEVVLDAFFVKSDVGLMRTKQQLEESHDGIFILGMLLYIPFS
jgi:hypothetical protein